MSKNSLKRKTVSLKLWILVGLICIVTAVWAVDLIRYSVRYTSDNYVGFRDSDIKINSSTDGQLDIDADNEIELTTTTVDLNGNLDVSGSIVGGSGGGFWAGAPLIGDPSAGFTYYEDFIATVLDSANGASGATSNKAQSATNATLAGWKGAGDAGWTITSAAGTVGGWVVFAAATGSNNEAYHQMGEIGTETYVEFVKSSGVKTWVEFRINPNSVATAGNLVFGLAEEGSAAADFINDSGADIADKDFVGFALWEAEPDSAEQIYQTSGGAFVVNDSTLVTANATSYGIYFDGDSTVSYYIGGTAVSTVLTTATGFPDGEELSPIIAIKNGAADRTVSLDWIKIVNER